MRHRSAFFLIAALCVPALAGCAAEASTQNRIASAVPAVPAATRRTSTVTSGCSGVGADSFVGGVDSNVADGFGATAAGGIGNDACTLGASIVGGEGNLVNAGTHDFVGGGYYNTISGTAAHATIAAGEHNGISQNDGFIGGGNNNVIGNYATAATIAGGENNGISLTGIDGSIGGGNGNAVTAEASTVAGGSANDNYGGYALIGGGASNGIQATGSYSVVGGGTANSISATYAAIAGGEHNTVSGEGGYIGGGGYNAASGEGAIVDGGFNSTATGTFATIPGGYVNSAGGTYSFAAGARASAAQTGTFVWSDGSDGDTILTSSRAYQFLARASGGVTFWTNAASTVGATLAPGSGTWASASDRHMKTDIAQIDDAKVLDKVAALPISRWSYKSERGVRHVGPMAQDFYAAFGVGEDDKHITSIDEDGVALSAIKALHAENARLRARLAAESRHDRRVDRELAQLRAAVRTLAQR